MSSRPNYFSMKAEVGKWWFSFPQSWRLCGNFDSREEAIAAAKEFFDRGATADNSLCWVGQYESKVVPGQPQCEFRLTSGGGA